ncbi:MAG: vanadium-dependent haloperoxidase [Gemmatimonadaceae bacterium]|nr:vanadium-dependent haloperoxidase [Gemmatimonadaceae bacterium]
MRRRFPPRVLTPRPIVAAIALVILAACGDQQVTAPPPLAGPSAAQAKIPDVSSAQTVVVRWSSACLQAIRLAKPAPTVVARALAIVHTAIYDAWAPYDNKALGTRLGDALRRPGKERTVENKRRAMSYAAYRSLVDLFPDQKASFDLIMADLGYDPADRSEDVTTATGIGNVAARKLLEFRHADGANQLGDLNPGAYTDYSGYAPVNTATQLNDPTRWQPLTINGVVQTFATPQFGRVTPFALTSGSQFRMPWVKPNEPFGGLQKAVDDVIGYSATLTDREKVIAEYWADGPHSELPPGHWCLFGALISARDRHSEDDDAKMFFAMANAGMDAGIAAWDLKRYFDTVRPVTAVRYYKAGQQILAWGGPGRGTMLIRGEDWRPYQPANVVTPPFAEYVSGHSTFSAASAEVLRLYTHSDRFGASVTIAPGTSLVEPGLVPAQSVTLSWPTFSAAADEAGMSRRYGGIHFEHADVQGRLIGRLIGAQAYAKAESYWEGKKDGQER